MTEQLTWVAGAKPFVSDLRDSDGTYYGSVAWVKERRLWLSVPLDGDSESHVREELAKQVIEEEACFKLYDMVKWGRSDLQFRIVYRYNALGMVEVHLWA